MTQALKVETTRVFEDNTRAWLGPSRRALNEGGTSSSKTYSILQLLVFIAMRAKTRCLISVVSESLPHLKRGCIRDFKNILGDTFDGNLFNKTENTYPLGEHGFFEFFPADEPSKMRGGRRDLLFINEANNVAHTAFKELDVRTRLFTFLDWNPVSEFWVHEYEADGKMVPGIRYDPENAYIHSTYLDAIHVLPRSVVENIESNRGKDPNWWNVYGLGLLGRIEGLVYPYFTQIPAMPEQHRGYEFFGLDFGYSTDPTVLVRNLVIGDNLYSEELLYEKGLTNDDIAQRLIELGIRRHYDEIFADAAEPKSIEEIYRYGFNIKGATKGPGSVAHGHQKVLQYKQHWTEDSLHCIKEQRNFRYITDKMGILTNKTTHMWSHGMDARRYGLVGAAEPLESEGILVYDSVAEAGINVDIV